MGRYDMNEQQQLAADLRDSVRNYRNPQTSAAEREVITQFWAKNHIRNQFSALLTAARIERRERERESFDALLEAEGDEES